MIDGSGTCLGIFGIIDMVIYSCIANTFLLSERIRASYMLNGGLCFVRQYRVSCSYDTKSQMAWRAMVPCLSWPDFYLQGHAFLHMDHR